MKVLFVSSGNKSNNSNLPGAVVYNQGQSLKKHGINIDYFLIKGKGLWGYLSNIKTMSRHIKKGQYDIIHAHYSLSAIIPTFAMLFTGSIPIVVSLMGSDTQLKGINRLIVKFLARFIWTKTIVKSKSIQKKTGIKNSTVIPNGVDINKIAAIEKELENEKDTFPRTKSAQMILFAANPERESKNYPLAKKAMNFVNNSTKLKVVYNTSHEKILEEILKADVVLLTSRWEGSPNIVKEAMTLNCPIVATNVGDIKWLLGNEPGHFITSFSPEDIAEKINQALAFAEKNECTNGRKRIIRLGLDAESISKKITEVYEKAVS